MYLLKCVVLINVALTLAESISVFSFNESSLFTTRPASFASVSVDENSLPDKFTICSSSQQNRLNTRTCIALWSMALKSSLFHQLSLLSHAEISLCNCYTLGTTIELFWVCWDQTGSNGSLWCSGNTQSSSSCGPTGTPSGWSLGTSRSPNLVIGTTFVLQSVLQKESLRLSWREKTWVECQEKI